MDYTKLKTKAYNQIVDKGAAMSIVRQTRSSFNASTGSYTTTETSYDCYGVRLNFKKLDHSKGSLVENSLQGINLIETTGIMFLVSAQGLTITPEKSDRVVFDSTTYEIEDVETISPNGTDLIYKVRARK